MNDMSQQQPQRIPDITIPSPALEQIFSHLNNSVLFAKSPDGSMRPFVDPNPIKQLLAQIIQNQMAAQQPSAGQAPQQNGGPNAV